MYRFYHISDISTHRVLLLAVVSLACSSDCQRSLCWAGRKPQKRCRVTPLHSNVPLSEITLFRFQVSLSLVPCLSRSLNEQKAPVQDEPWFPQTDSNPARVPVRFIVLAGRAVLSHSHCCAHVDSGPVRLSILWTAVRPPLAERVLCSVCTQDLWPQQGLFTQLKSNRVTLSPSCTVTNWKGSHLEYTSRDWYVQASLQTRVAQDLYNVSSSQYVSIKKDCLDCNKYLAIIFKVPHI